MGAEIDENNLPLTISDGKVVIGTYEGAVKIADYLARGYLVDDNGNVYKPSQSGGSTGSSGGSNPTYSPKIEVSGGGIVAVNPRTPKAGDGATIAVAPDAGCEVDEVRVTARNGSDLALTSNGNGIYTLTQPAGQVVIGVAFIHSGITLQQVWMILARLAGADPAAWRRPVNRLWWTTISAEPPPAIRPSGSSW